MLKIPQKILKRTPVVLSWVDFLYFLIRFKTLHFSAVALSSSANAQAMDPCTASNSWSSASDLTAAIRIKYYYHVLRILENIWKLRGLVLFFSLDFIAFIS